MSSALDRLREIQAQAVPKRPGTLASVRPSLGFQIAYRRRLEKLIARMQADIVETVTKLWKRKRPEMAADESPAMAFRAAIAALGRDWQARFDRLAPDLAAYFAQDVSKRTDAQLRAILRKGGFTVDFKMTRAMNDVLQAAIGENVSLIRSIGSEHFTSIEGAVMRSVATGRDLASLSAELQKAYGVTRRRAALIARDQNNKATAVIVKTRQQELGIETAIWKHSHAGRHPRPTHIENDGKPYDIAEGWLDPALGKRIWPGTEINCRCYSRSVLPGL